MHKTPIFPGANIPATNRKFFFVAGMLRHGFCRTTRRFSHKTRIFPGANTPAINKIFCSWPVCPATDFAPRSGFFRRKTRPGCGRNPADRRRHAVFHTKHGFFPGPTHPPSTKIFCSWRVCSKHGFCRTTRRFSHKTRIFPGANTPAITEEFSAMTGMLCHGFSTAVRFFQILNGSANPGDMPPVCGNSPAGPGETAAVRRMAERYGDGCREGSGSALGPGGTQLPVAARDHYPRR